VRCGGGNQAYHLHRSCASVMLSNAFGNALGSSLAEQMQRGADEEAARKKLYSVGGQSSGQGLKFGSGLKFSGVPVSYEQVILRLVAHRLMLRPYRGFMRAPATGGKPVLTMVISHELWQG
jgi:hypothetical protein